MNTCQIKKKEKEKRYENRFLNTQEIWVNEEREPT